MWVLSEITSFIMHKAILEIVTLTLKWKHFPLLLYNSSHPSSWDKIVLFFFFYEVSSTWESQSFSSTSLSALKREGQYGIDANVTSRRDWAVFILNLFVHPTLNKHYIKSCHSGRAVKYNSMPLDHLVTFYFVIRTGHMTVFG